VNKSSKGFVHLFVIIILALAVVGGIGYYAYKNGQIRFTPSQKQTIVLPTPDPTVNWKSYRNEKFGYFVKYHDDETIKQNNCGENPNDFNGEEKFVLVPEIADMATCYPLEWYASLEINVYTGNLSTLDSVKKEFGKDWEIKYEPVFIDGQEGNRYFLKYANPSNETGCCPDFQMVRVYNNNYSYEIVLGNELTFPETFDQILSTFRFLDNDKVNVPLQNLLNDPKQYSSKRICTEGYFYDALETSALVKSFDEENKKLVDKPLIWVENETNKNILTIIVDKKAVRKLGVCGLFEAKGSYGHLRLYPYLLKLQNFTALDEVIYF